MAQCAAFLAQLHRDLGGAAHLRTLAQDIFGLAVLEIRMPKYNDFRQTASGYFDNIEDAARAVQAWDGRANIYCTLNPVNPALHARARNRIDLHATTATADEDVLGREWLFFDIDSVRPSGISSTEDELAAAQDVLARLTAFLASKGWPDPIACVSGNGCYALYPVALPNDATTTDLVKRVLQALADRFDTDAAHIDTTVSNPARIIALVGTLKMKGDATADRPHRRSYVMSAPDSLATVTRDQLEQLAERSAQAAAPKPALVVVPRTGNLEDALCSAGIEYREQPADANGVTWYHLPRCPFHTDGRDFECGIGQKLPDGAYSGHCFHPEGQGRGWQDFKRALGIHMACAKVVYRALCESSWRRPSFWSSWRGRPTSSCT